MNEGKNQQHLDMTSSPCHGPTLSTSTSSFELREPYDAKLGKMATKAFDKINTYVIHDMDTTMDNYKVLEQMNRSCETKYSDMQQISENLLASSHQLKEKFESLVLLHPNLHPNKQISYFSFSFNVIVAVYQSD